MQPVTRRRIAIGASSLPGSARVFSSAPAARPSSLQSSPPQPLSRPKQTPLYLPRQQQCRPFSVSFRLNQETHFQSTSADNGLPTSGTSRLTSRSLVSLSGPDAVKFLRGIITNELPTDHTSLSYAAFLSAQGRVLNDVLIYLDPRPPQSADSFLIEVSALEAPTLVKHLKRYRLRSKCAISLLSPEEANVYALWGSTPTSGENIHSYPDPRFPPSAPCHRLLAFGTEPTATQPEQTYHVLRYSLGVAEGQQEILRDSALPHESNLDLLSGVDFRKGCYVGQELTIRTEHRGVVRKRILPAILYPSTALPPHSLQYFDVDLASKITPGVNVTRVGKRGRPAGKWLAGIGNLGLVLGRLEMMTDLRLPGEDAIGAGMGYKEGDEFEVDVEGRDEKVRVKAFVPGWLRKRLGERMEKKRRRG